MGNAYCTRCYIVCLLLFFVCSCLSHRNDLHGRAFLDRALWQIFICEIIIIHTKCIYTNSIAMDHLCTYIWISWRNNTSEKNGGNYHSKSEQIVQNKFINFMLKANTFQFLFCFTLKFPKLMTIAKWIKKNICFAFDFLKLKNKAKKEKLITNWRKMGQNHKP